MGSLVALQLIRTAAERSKAIEKELLLQQIAFQVGSLSP
jgi:hypothetical protein